MRKLFCILRYFIMPRYGGHLGRIGRALAVWLMSCIIDYIDYVTGIVYEVAHSIGISKNT